MSTAYWARAIASVAASEIITEDTRELVVGMLDYLSRLDGFPGPDSIKESDGGVRIIWSTHDRATFAEVTGHTMTFGHYGIPLPIGWEIEPLRHIRETYSRHQQETEQA